MIATLPGAQLQKTMPPKPTLTSTNFTPLKPIILNKLQPVSNTPIQNCCYGEKLNLMPAHPISNHLTNLGAKPLTQSQRILNEAGFQRVKIGGDDNRCWVRAPWFALLQQHTKADTLGALNDQMQELIYSSSCSDVVNWRESNPNGIANAMTELTSSDGLNNHTLNKKGYFSPAVEDLIENVSKAIFHANPKQSTAMSEKGPVNALHLLSNNKCGFQAFSNLLLKKLDGNAPLHSETGQFNLANVNVEWLGTDHLHQKQADCIVFHLPANAGHFEIMLNDANFKPASHTEQPAVLPQRKDKALSLHKRSLALPFQTSIKQADSLNSFNLSPKAKLKQRQQALAWLLMISYVAPVKSMQATFNCLQEQLEILAFENRTRRAKPEAA